MLLSLLTKLKEEDSISMETEQESSVSSECDDQKKIQVILNPRSKNWRIPVNW